MHGRFGETSVLVLTGEKASGNFLIEQARLVATNVQGQVVDGSGHWLMEEAPQVVIPSIIKLVNNLGNISFHWLRSFNLQQDALAN